MISKSIKFSFLVRHNKVIFGEPHECIDFLPDVVIDKNGDCFDTLCLKAAKTAYDQMECKKNVLEVCLASCIPHPIIYEPAELINKRYSRKELD